MAGPMVSAVKCMLLGSALYEPLRNALHRLEEDVGGVGGVGGLCNMGNPGSCDSLAGVTGNYCFKPGVWAGLTGFAIVVLLAWTSPIIFSAMQMSMSKGDSRDSQPNGEAEQGRDRVAQGFLTIWSGLSCLWFAMPFAYMMADPFYRSGVVSFLLAVALAAAFPLSWHLSFLALPVNEAVGPLLGLSKASIVGLHKALGWRTAFWGCLHATGELLYLLSNGGFMKFFQLSGKDGENLLYLLGLLTALLLLLQVFLAFVRRSLSHFKSLHRAVAVAILLSATAHWWPFVFFLLPSAAAHGASLAGSSNLQRQSLALAAALLASLAALLPVWKLREVVMMKEDVGLVLPFIFPPLALLAEFLAAALAAWAVLFRAPPRLEGTTPLMS